MRDVINQLSLPHFKLEEKALIRAILVFTPSYIAFHASADVKRAILKRFKGGHYTHWIRHDVEHLLKVNILLHY